MRAPEYSRLCPLKQGVVPRCLCEEVQAFVDGDFPFSEEMRDFVQPEDYSRICRECDYRREWPAGGPPCG